METLAQTLLTLALGASWIYWILTWITYRNFTRFHKQPAEFTPPVSILKPVKGLDFQAYENFCSFCRLDYPKYEVIFGVLDPADPAISVIRRLQKDHPHMDIRLVIGKPLGQNGKVSNLYHMEKKARHDILVISDSDMRVRRDYLKRVISPLRDPQVRLVTCLYRGVEARSWTAFLEALYIITTFIPSVVMGRRLIGMRFALGATIVIRKGDLRELIGGFEALKDHLADDYQMGARVASRGFKVHLLPYFVDYVLGPITFKEMWSREVRWARCIKTSRHWGYLGMITTFSTPLGLVYAIGLGLSSQGMLVLLFSILLRWAVCREFIELSGAFLSKRVLLFLPLRDVLNFFVWSYGLVGKRVYWRGTAYDIQQDGHFQSVRGMVR
jgi:ceramide glucosyltransferase